MTLETNDYQNIRNIINEEVEKVEARLRRDLDYRTTQTENHILKQETNLSEFAKWFYVEHEKLRTDINGKLDALSVQVAGKNTESWKLIATASISLLSGITIPIILLVLHII